MKLVDISVIIRKETPLAVCVTEDGVTDIWLPKSLIEIEKGKDRSAVITMPEWVYKDKGFIS